MRLHTAWLAGRFGEPSVRPDALLYLALASVSRIGSLRFLPQSLHLYIRRRTVTDMASMTETLKVTETSEIGPLLNDADEGPVLLEKDGVVYRLSRVVDAVDEADEDVNDVESDIDPDYVESVLNATLGIWADIDAEALIAELYEARELGSRPFDRPRPFDPH